MVELATPPEHKLNEAGLTAILARIRETSFSIKDNKIGTMLIDSTENKFLVEVKMNKPGHRVNRMLTITRYEESRYFIRGTDKAAVYIEVQCKYKDLFNTISVAISKLALAPV